MPYNTIMQETLTRTYRKFADPPKSPTVPRVVCYDLDDTLAWYCKTRRLPGCAEFEPTPLLAEALKHQSEGTGIILASARPEWCIDGTRTWCERHGLTPTAIYLKNRYCSLPAHEMKMTMLDDIASAHEILRFYDDSMLTVLAALDLGIDAVWVQGNEIYWEDKARAMGWHLPDNWRAIIPTLSFGESQSDCSAMTDAIMRGGSECQ